MKEARNFEAEDIFFDQVITGIHAAPSKALAVCSVKSINQTRKGYESSLWLCPLDGSGQPQRFTRGPVKTASRAGPRTGNRSRSCPIVQSEA